MSALAMTAADEEKLRGLKRMKVVAIGALVVAAVVYVVAFIAESNGVSWAGYFRAAGEAGMVEMLAAAEELRFEYAAKLRDEIKELRRELSALADAPA